MEGSADGDGGDGFEGCCQGVGTPSSLGYLGRKLLVFSGLRRVVSVKYTF